MSNLTSYSPDGIKLWGAANKEELVQKTVSTFGKIGDKFKISETYHVYDGGVVFILCECS